MSLSAEIHTSIEAIGEKVWDRLAPNDNPFLSYRFLYELEASKSVGPQESGWLPHHIELKDGDDTCALIPLYIKLDSYGEYIFDWAWARAAHQAGIQYYPKLVVAVPFTPVTGQRILWGNAGESTELWTKCLEALKLFAKRLEASSVHILFCTDSESQQIAQHEGWEARLSRQYHWQRRPEWACFEDYLNSMKSRHRKAVRRERRLIKEQGLEIRPVRGEELTREHWRKLRDFYLYTVHAKGGYPYLSAAFFEQGNAQAKHALAFFAYLNDEPIAGALCFHAGANLYGRYWGTQLYSPSLHFELCYYAPIEWALNNGIARYEAGAQGEHKIKRGFEPVACHSAHYIVHPRLREAIGEYLSHERANTEDELLYLSKFSPFRVEQD